MLVKFSYQKFQMDGAGVEYVSSSGYLLSAAINFMLEKLEEISKFDTQTHFRKI